MAFTIPSATFDSYFEVVDELINNTYIGQTITLYYTETITQIVDTSHHLKLVDGPSINFGPDGQPVPFNKQEGGTSYSEIENTETIRVRWYPDPKDWKRILTVVTPDTKVLIIGKRIDLEKLVRANQIGSEINNKIQKYVLSGEPQKWGFGEVYFVAALKEA